MDDKLLKRIRFGSKEFPQLIINKNLIIWKMFI